MDKPKSVKTKAGHTSNLEKTLSDIFDRAANSDRYDWGIKEIEKRIGNERIQSEKILYWLGFLYDHEALSKSGKNRKSLEDKALRLYTRALAINPGDANSKWGIARVWWHRESKRAIPYAIDAYKTVKKSSSRSGGMALNVGIVYETLGDYKNAVVWAKKGLKELRSARESKLAILGAYVTLSRIHLATDNIRQAKKCAAEAKSLMHSESRKISSPRLRETIRKTIKQAENA